MKLGGGVARRAVACLQRRGSSDPGIVQMTKHLGLVWLPSWPCVVQALVECVRVVVCGVVAGGPPFNGLRTHGSSHNVK